MVVSFGRSTFKFTEDRVSICLEAVLGGLCGEFKVSLISERVFSFRVASKQVGFHIIKLRNLFVPSSHVIFIYGDMEGRIGNVNTSSGLSRMLMSGLWSLLHDLLEDEILQQSQY
jgi:hypothetical protein